MKKLVSAEGVQQGGPLSTILFCLEIQDMMGKFITSPQIECFACADDITFASKDKVALKDTVRELGVVMREANLELRPDKCKHLELGSDDGVVVCGAPIGSKRFECEFFEKKIDDLNKTLNLLMKVLVKSNGQMRWVSTTILFRSCT